MINLASAQTRNMGSGSGGNSAVSRQVVNRGRSIKNGGGWRADSF